VLTYHGLGFSCQIEIPATEANKAKGVEVFDGSVWRRTK